MHICKGKIVKVQGCATVAFSTRVLSPMYQLSHGTEQLMAYCVQFGTGKGFRKKSVILFSHHLMSRKVIFELQNIYRTVIYHGSSAFNLFFPINATPSVVVLLSWLRALFATVRTPRLTLVLFTKAANFAPQVLFSVQKISEEILGLGGFHCLYRYGKSDQIDETQADISNSISCPIPPGIVGRATQANTRPTEPITIYVSLLTSRNPEKQRIVTELSFALSACWPHSTCRSCVRWQGLCFWSRLTSRCFAERTTITEQSE